MTPDKFQGCLLGLALGDALGAPFEGGIPERLLWALIGRTRQGEMRWTDDTQMSLDLAESIIEKQTLDPDDLAVRFARNYRWSRGYGRGAAKVLKQIARGVPWQTASRSVFPGGSYGNGGAMRSPIIGLYFFCRPGELMNAARVACSVTHVHPDAIEGAVLVATATALAASGKPAPFMLQKLIDQSQSGEFQKRLQHAHRWLDSGNEPGPGEIAKMLGNGMAAANSCVTAIYLAFRFMGGDFLEMLKFIQGGGGDVDTIGAMAGAIWGAANGLNRLPGDRLQRLEQRDRLMSVSAALHERTAAG